MQKILFLFIVITLSGCTANPTKSNNLPPDYANKLSQKLKYKPKITSSPRSIKQKLLSQYKNWKGTPYLYGGLSKQGIDCSGFVQTTFKAQFSKQLPRTTEQQAKLGTSVSKSKIRAGDLVFFKTGYKKSHVGIALDSSEFMHASTSKGVIISKLNNPYWQKNYRFSIRL